MVAWKDRRVIKMFQLMKALKLIKNVEKKKTLLKQLFHWEFTWEITYNEE